MHHNSTQRNVPQSIAGRLAYKEKLINLLAFKKKMIADLESKRRSPKLLLEMDSSSEDEFMEVVQPSMRELKQQLNLENILLRAVEELTDLKILNKTIQVLPVPPEFEGEEAGNVQREEGTWKEVTAECKIESVLFSLHFFMFESGNQFEGPTFHNVTPTVVKKHQAVELQNSALYSAATPSDAVDCLNRYAKAVRSRRETLKALAEASGEGLLIEQAEDGSIKCVVLNLLSIVWRLENCASPLAPFRHRMTFDIEYMDEVYLRSIKSAYKALRDPKLTTLDRTEILSNIINVCLQAEKAKRETDGQTDTDVTTDTEQRRNVTLDHGDVGNTEIQELVCSTPKKLKVLPRRVDKHIDDVISRKGGHEIQDDQAVAGPSNVNNKMFKIPISPKKKNLNSKRPNTDTDGDRPNKIPKLGLEEIADGSKKKKDNFGAVKNRLDDIVNTRKNNADKISRDKASQQKSGNIYAKSKTDNASNQQPQSSQVAKEVASEMREAETNKKETQLSEGGVKAKKLTEKNKQRNETKSSGERERLNEAKTKQKEMKLSEEREKTKQPDLPGEKEKRKETKSTGGSKKPKGGELPLGSNLHKGSDFLGESNQAKEKKIPKRTDVQIDTEVAGGSKDTKQTELSKRNKKLEELKLREERMRLTEKYVNELENQNQNNGKDKDKNSEIVDKNIGSRGQNETEVTKNTKAVKKSDLANVPQVPESRLDNAAINNIHLTKRRNIFGVACKNSFAVNIADPSNANSNDNPKKNFKTNINKLQANKPSDTRQNKIEDNNKIVQNKVQSVKPVARTSKPLNTINKNVPIIRSQATTRKETNVDINKENPKVGKKIISNPKTGEKIVLKPKTVPAKPVLAQTSQKIPRLLPPRKPKRSHIPVLKSRLEGTASVSHASGKS